MAMMNVRQQAILEMLSQQDKLTAQDLMTHFDISIATAYRDMNQLVNSGSAMRIQGGIAWAPAQERIVAARRCNQCGHSIESRTSFTIQLPGGGQLVACCPHCGLLLLGQHPEALNALATDFLYVKKINVSQAVFLVNSDVTVCCSPSVLCFSHRNEAESFQKGFGGEALRYEAALEQIIALMSLQPGHANH